MMIIDLLYYDDYLFDFIFNKKNLLNEKKKLNKLY